MFDAYTVKKVLPRLAIAVVLIQLSFFIFSGFISLTTSIAYGLEDLIYAPFGAQDEFTLEVLLSEIGGSDLQSLFTGAIIAGAGLAVLGGAIGMVAIGVFMAVLMGVLALVVRRVMLILLLIVSPLALVAWILPNTERFWKMWWDNFSKLLLMYPIILGMLAIGRVFSKIGADSSDEVIGVFIVLGGVFIPMAMIPRTFNMAGAGFAAIGGRLGQIGSQGLQRGWNAGKDKRTKQLAEKGQDFLAGTGNSRTRFGKGVNKLGQRIGAKGGFSLNKEKRQNAMKNAGVLAAQRVMQRDTSKAMQYDDLANEASTYASAKEAEAGLTQELQRRGHSAEEAAKMAKDATKRASAIGFGGAYAVAAAQRMAASKTGFKDAAHAEAVINRATRGNAGAQTDLRETVKYTSKQVGRHDLGALRTRRDGESREEWNRSMVLAGAQTADAATLARDHKDAMDNITAAIAGSAGTAEQGDAAVLAAELEAAGVYATLGNKPAIEAAGESMSDPRDSLRNEEGEVILQDVTKPVQRVEDDGAGGLVIRHDTEVVGQTNVTPMDAARSRVRAARGAGNPDDPRLAHPEPPAAGDDEP